MLSYASLLLLAFAVSLDGFGVGVTYGLRKIRIPLAALVVVSLWSGVVIFASMLIGTWFTTYLSAESAKVIGALILIGIGLWALVQIMRQKDDSAETPDSGVSPSLREQTNEMERTEDWESVRHIFTWELRRFGLVVQILRTPMAADVDKSGNISVSEAMLLGIALSLDSFGAGIGAGLIGFSPALTSIVIAVASGTFIAAGLKVGLKYAETDWMRRLAYLPGCVLIAMGIMKLFL
ncbi:MntP/YtaF family protein [Paenibacillus chartarius]|uniref:MntP/YtaF family protein n=1 Tax=Paenibacillus chartarius TaxID=747481 RepID=A0ABV6DUK5_9BACL